MLIQPVAEFPNLHIFIIINRKALVPDEVLILQLNPRAPQCAEHCERYTTPSAAKAQNYQISLLKNNSKAFWILAKRFLSFFAAKIAPADASTFTLRRAVFWICLFWGRALLRPASLHGFQSGRSLYSECDEDSGACLLRVSIGRAQLDREFVDSFSCAKKLSNLQSFRYLQVKILA